MWKLTGKIPLQSRQLFLCWFKFLPIQKFPFLICKLCNIAVFNHSQSYLNYTLIVLLWFLPLIVFFCHRHSSAICTMALFQTMGENAHQVVRDLYLFICGIIELWAYKSNVYSFFPIYKTFCGHFWNIYFKIVFLSQNFPIFSLERK